MPNEAVCEECVVRVGARNGEWQPLARVWRLPSGSRIEAAQQLRYMQAS